MSMRIAGLAPLCFYFESEKLGSIESKADQIVHKIEEIRIMVMEIMTKDKADPKTDYYASIQDESQGTSYTAIVQPMPDEAESKCDHCDMTFVKTHGFQLNFKKNIETEVKAEENEEESSSEEANSDDFDFPEEIAIAYSLGGLHRLTRHPETGPHKCDNTQFYEYLFPTGQPNP